jgi:GGDEF domain-containing protein
VSTELQALFMVPFRARPQNGGTAALARTLLRRGEARSTAAIAMLQKDSPPPQLRRVRRLDRAYFETLHRIYLVGISPGGYGPKADRLAAIGGGQLGRINTEIAAAGRAYAGRARTAQNEVLAGSGAAVTLLFLAFAAFYRRSASAHLASARLAAENGRLLETSRGEARTDPLTGLPNRRALMAALDAEFEADAPVPAILALYDLDGFKRYNDTFGHPAGDALLVRLGARLQASLEPIGATAYRMGGDEFSVLAPADCAEIPAEAGSVAEALHIADLRMYADKSSGRPAAIDQSTDVLLALIDERGADLRDHVENVALLAELTAERMGLPVADIRQVVLPARLHDIGTAAIPDAIVTKPDDLDLPCRPGPRGDRPDRAPEPRAL